MNRGGSSIKQVAHAGASGKTALDARSRGKIEKASNELEAIRVNTVMKSMRNTIPPSRLRGDGFGNDIMEGMFDKELPRRVASRANLGFGEMLYRNLLDRVSDGNSVLSEQRPTVRAGKKERPAATRTPGPTKTRRA
jgi:flagellar protein FlgJ